MKTNKNTLLRYIGILLLMTLIMSSCEEYLDKAPEADISEEDVFKKFITFQGYMEDIYQNVVDETVGKEYREHNFNWGDELVHNWRGALVEQFQLGNYWAIWSGFVGFQNNYSPFSGQYVAGNNARGRGYWDNGWRGIRQASMALINLNKMVDATEEQRNLIAGQAYFFRAYFHFEIIRHFGGMPYIDTIFSPSDELRLSRLSYRECAAKATADLEKAAQLLPYDWDETEAGKATLGSNRGRLTKGAAYGYLGKNLLYSASPLIEGETTGSYTYNVDLCKQAAKAFWEVIKMVPKYYDLWSWNEYYKNFYTLTGELTMIGKECIFNNPVYMSKRNVEGDWKSPYIGGGSGDYASVSANYVENFGMANGLPIMGSTADTLGCGYNPQNPWVNRDPRFYYNIILDRERILVNYENINTYATFYTGGRMRGNCYSGYGQKKYHHITCNRYDNGWSDKYYWECPQMRLADVYLMYAEAVNQGYGGGNVVPSDIPGAITAAEAVNRVRRRVEVSPGVPLPDVDPRFYPKDKFQEFLIMERAAELALETHRWYDLRRWHVAHELKYRERYIMDFPQDWSYFRKTLLDTRVFDDKHYWLPLHPKMVTLYREFYQNPGW